MSIPRDPSRRHPSRPLLALALAALAAPLAAEELLPSSGPVATIALDLVEADGDNAVYLVTVDGVFRATGGADVWVRQAIIDGAVALAHGGGFTFAVDDDLRIRPDGDFWPQEIDEDDADRIIDLPTGVVRGISLAANDARLVMIGVDGAGDTALYALEHGASSWTTVGTGLPADELIRVIATLGNVLVATRTQGIWRSNSTADNFNDVGQPDVEVVDWAVDADGLVLLMTDGTDMYRNATGGTAVWESTSPGIADITAVGVRDEGTLYFGTANEGLYSATSWPTFALADSGRFGIIRNNIPLGVGAIGRLDDQLIVGSTGRGPFVDRGTAAGLEEPGSSALGGEILSMSTGRDFTEQVVGTRGGGVFLTFDAAVNWDGSNNNIDAQDIYALLRDEDTLYAGTEDGFRRTSMDTFNWQTAGEATLAGVPVRALLLDGSRLVIGTDAGIHYSDDDGDSWTLADAGVVTHLVDDGSMLHAAGEGLYLVSSDGSSWSAGATTGTSGTPQRVFLADDRLWLATDGGTGFYESSDGGTTWSAVDTGILGAGATIDVLQFIGHEDQFYLGEATAGLWVSFTDDPRWRDLYEDLPLTSGGDVAPVTAFQVFDSDTLPPEEGAEEEEEEESDPGPDVILVGLGGYGLHGATAATPGTVSFLIHPGRDFVGLVLDDGNLTANVTRNSPDDESEPRGLLFSLGYYSFQVTKVDPGQAVTIEMTFPDGAVPDTYYKYGPTPDDPEDHWYEFLYDGTTGAVIDGNVITLHLVDGDRGDDDLTANGTINDPGGPAYFVDPASGGSMSWLLLPLAAVLLARRRREVAPAVH